MAKRYLTRKGLATIGFIVLLIAIYLIVPTGSPEDILSLLLARELGWAAYLTLVAILVAALLIAFKLSGRRKLSMRKLY